MQQEIQFLFRYGGFLIVQSKEKFHFYLTFILLQPNFREQVLLGLLYRNLNRQCLFMWEFLCCLWVFAALEHW